MKLDMNGMFRLKNLGRSLIHVNGEEVAPGHALSLRSGCLIEVITIYMRCIYLYLY